MSAMRKVPTPKTKFENPTVKKFKLGMRDLINKYSGQESLIGQYYAAIQVIANASAKSKSAEFKKRAGDILHAVEGGEWVTDGTAFWEQGGFNPFKPFQKKVLRQKIAQLSAAIKELGIER
ncbi:MAG: hypothetical protein K2M34_03085 [Alphaproteobacteria bacterium]|nr:hypothetical protein [Alphaproteobacteria bacterium]